MSANIAIVIAAYNRPSSLQRLLDSISKADYGDFQSIPLIVSIDYSGSNECILIAERFFWQKGQKTVLLHETHLGLKKHVLSCGDLTDKYDAVIVLEDDLLVSPFFYHYAQQAYTFYQTDEAIAGIALYHNTFNEVACCPFEPIHDGYDVYFMQVPCSWGQLWTKKQWQAFEAYIANLQDDSFARLPRNVQNWPDLSSWKKLFYSYVVESRKYFVYPRVGLSTNFGDAGQHLAQPHFVFQTSLLLARRNFLFQCLDNSLSIYDGFYELDGSVYNKVFQTNISVSFDLNGTKPLSNVETTFLISSRKCKGVERKFSVACYPYENNVLLEIEAAESTDHYFSLAKTNQFVDAKQFERLAIDIKRVFLNDVFIKQAVLREFEQSKEFRIGNTLLKPFRYLKGKRLKNVWNILFVKE